MFKRILIANRGEIAMRVIRCCHEMGIETVQAYSWEDRDSLPVQISTESVCIGPAPAKDSYLNQAAIIEAAKAMKCDAIHPGYGFLSENEDFARKCERSGIAWIGPSADLIHMMGDKQSAKTLMKKNGVPVVPGSDGLLKDVDDAKQTAKKIGYPVLLKATAGGGGRGMRIAYDESEIEGAYTAASAEARSAFGNRDLYLEKLILNPRHIEVQILGDHQGNIIHLGDRDCSIQRRRQKMIEESPAVGISDHQRLVLYRTAVRAAKAARYVSAGTVEFVFDKEGHFYFIEMNTRIQVEHTVTEMLTGIDLIREQIRIAAGLELTIKQSAVRMRGHVIECRVNAEDPEKDFAPCPGKIGFLHMPGGFGIRVESAMYSGCSVSPYYDSMVAKIIVQAPSRLKAIRKMRVALEEMIVDGVNTDINFLYLIMFNHDYMLGNFDTSFLSGHKDMVMKWDKESRKGSR